MTDRSIGAGPSPCPPSEWCCRAASAAPSSAASADRDGSPSWSPPLPHVGRFGGHALGVLPGDEAVELAEYDEGRLHAHASFPADEGGLTSEGPARQGHQATPDPGKLCVAPVG